MQNATLTVLALVAMMAFPLVLAAPPLGVETLRGGSFEGPEGYVQSGWQLMFRSGAETVNEIDDGDVAHTGLQGVNLGKSHPTHVAGIALGKVSVIPATLGYVGPEIMPGAPEAATSAVRFADINGVSIWSRLAAQTDQILLQPMFEIRTQVLEQASPLSPADTSYCVVQWGDDLWAPSSTEWQQHVADGATEFIVFDARCARWIAGPAPLSAFQSNPAFADAKLIAVTVQSMPLHAVWDGPALYVDDLSVTMLPAVAPEV